MPACTGRPESAPEAEFNVIPAGNTPSLRVHVYGGVPPVAATLSEYGEPALPFAREAVVIASCEPMVIVHDFDAVAPVTSATCSENVESPAAVGVPEMTPESLASSKPAGSDPDPTVHA